MIRTLERCMNAGIVVLDGRHPEWLPMVDIDRLDMASTHDGLLGQIYGSYLLGRDTLGMMDRAVVGGFPSMHYGTELWAAKLGFFHNEWLIGRHKFEPFGFKELTDAWRWRVTILTSERERGP